MPDPDDPWFCDRCQVWASDGHECEIEVEILWERDDKEETREQPDTR